MEDDVVFWERLRDMPDIEAVQELSLRRTELIERAQRIKTFWLGRFARMSVEDGATLAGIDLTLTKIKEESKLRNLRIDNASWRNAVRTVLGVDAYEACREWIMINGR